MQLSQGQFQGLQTASRTKFEGELASWLRAHRTAYVDDLTDTEL